MRTAAGRLVFIFLIVVGLNACSSPSPPSQLGTGGIKPGEPMPPVALMRLDNAVGAQLRDYQGRVVVLNLWGTWCAACRRELPSLERLARVLDKERFAVLGIALESDGYLVQEYLRDRGVTFAEHIAPDYKALVEQLGAKVFPTTLIVSSSGTLLARIVGERVWNTDDVVRQLEGVYRGELTTINVKHEM